MTATVHADVDVEQAVLGALLLYSDPRHTLAAASRGLTPESFYGDRNRAIFKAALSLAERSASIDEMTVMAELDRLGLGRDVERAQVGLLASYVPAAGNVSEYVDRVIELAQWRAWQRAAQEAWAATERRDQQALAKAQAMFSSHSVRTRHDTYSPEQWGALLFDYFSSPSEVIKQRAVPLVFNELTLAAGGGVGPGEFATISGPTGHGKTTLSAQVMDSAAAQGKRCHAYATEMTAVARGMRYLASRTGIPFMRQRRNDLTEDERKLILAELSHMDYGYSIVADWTIDDVVRDALRARYDLVVVDLLHGFHYEDERGLDRLSKAMQRLARVSTTIDGHPGTAVIAVTHLKEEGVVRGKIPRPTIASIKGGSSIKQDADMVMFVWQEQDDRGAPNGDGEIWIAKGRSMELARVDVRLNPRWFRFERRPTDADIAEVASATTSEKMPF